MSNPSVYHASADEACSSDSSKSNIAKTGDGDTDTGDVTAQTEFTQEWDLTTMGGEARPVALRGFENYDEALENWEDDMLVCRQLLESMPRVQRCLRSDDLNPLRRLYFTGWRAMEEYRVAARIDGLDLSFLVGVYGKKTVDELEHFLRRQMAVVRNARETLHLGTDYVDMLAPMLKYVDSQYDSRPWGTEDNRTAGDAEMEAVQDLLRQVARLKEENFALRRQIAARAAPKSESAAGSSLARWRQGMCPRCCNAMARPGMQAKSPVASIVSSELRSVPSSRSAGSMPLAAADGIVPKGRNIAHLMDESLVMKHQRNSDTFSEGQAELLQEPLSRTGAYPVTEWLSRADQGSWDEPSGAEQRCAPCDEKDEANASLAARYRDLAEDSRLLEEDFQQLSEEYNALSAEHSKTIDKYDLLKDKFDDVLEEYDLLRKRYDYERVVHNRVTAMYVTNTSEVIWNGSTHNERESPSVSPKTAVPYRKRTSRPSSPAPDDDGAGSPGQTFYGFVTHQWLCWMAIYDLVWSPLLPPSKARRGTPWSALFTMLTHVALVASLLSWLSCQLERDIWLQANGLTRNQLIAHTRGELVWLSNLQLGGEARTLALWMALNSRRLTAFGMRMVPEALLWAILPVAAGLLFFNTPRLILGTY